MKFEKLATNISLQFNGKLEVLTRIARSLLLKLVACV